MGCMQSAAHSSSRSPACMFWLFIKLLGNVNSCPWLRELLMLQSIACQSAGWTLVNWAVLMALEMLRLLKQSLCGCYHLVQEYAVYSMLLWNWETVYVFTWCSLLCWPEHHMCKYTACRTTFSRHMYMIISDQWSATIYLTRLHCIGICSCSYRSSCRRHAHW